MSGALNLLVIAPFAPPQNAAEAIQVRRILSALDSKAIGRLVTVPITTKSWAKRDASLELTLQHFDVQNLTLPWHGVLSRIFMSHRLAWLHRPDAYFWITWMVRRIARQLKTKPDAIYSRSYPISAALLARKLKQKLCVPWVMHLSDPWADSPYATSSVDAQVEEAKSFAQADMITLTTQSQAEHYRKKYPAFTHKISVSPNVMPLAQDMPNAAISSAIDSRLSIVFAGNLYGNRTPKPLIDALELLQQRQPELLQQLRIDIYGNAQDEALSLLQRLPTICHYHGAVSFHDAYLAQCRADIVLSIEPDFSHPLSASFLPSKVVDSLALGKPLLAITPQGSETEALCHEGYGWAVPPSKPELLADCLMDLINKRTLLRETPAKIPPARYDAKTVTDSVLNAIKNLQQVSIS